MLRRMCKPLLQQILISYPSVARKHLGMDCTALMILLMYTLSLESTLMQQKTAGACKFCTWDWQLCRDQGCPGHA